MLRYDMIRDAIEVALQNEGYEPEGRRKEIAFHMTDCLGDLRKWQSFCDDPNSMDSKQVEALLTAFLLHVPNHLAAASKLMLGVPVADIFEVGALSNDD